MKRIATEVSKLSDDELRSLLTAGERPTLKTIARISGLAITTVSRAMRNGADIGTDTKELVARIADAIGYVPNRAGLRLRTGRTNVITLVVPAESDLLNNLSKLTSSIAKEMRGTQFHLNVLPWFPDEDPLRPIKYIVETGSADAVIFNMTEPDDERVAYLLKKKFPFVTHGRTKWADQHAYYDYDNTAFIRVALRRLAKRGRKNILAILPPRNQNYSQDMVRGLEQESEILAIQYRISKNVDSDKHSDEIQHWVTRRLDQSPEIDAVLCTSSKAAIAAIVAIEKHGRKLGQDIDVYGKEVIPILNMFRENIIVEMEDIGPAGRFLAKAAIQQLQDPDLPLMQHLEIPVDTSE
ncbi:LacI family transcriptional regulator [Pelagimonas varians]|uniref:HTH-type transcriptional regulator RafR n=1 Tax=Pelagimonas varians TaxID=696760 RepID=A0A238KWJ3_9RHOB|nr:LacI family transcriptional regulator [Pelagimonas varians]PYG27981.1 LacI family transcriptional regulator [Pelagimonas varians]SMX47149.1 HTH-type transcriptional regulator RafR [Pelagimonas varians]